MPLNRAEVARDEKVAEIVDAARRRLLDGGFGSLSVADIARELSVAQNAIYWYFPTKDHLFVAAAEPILHHGLARGCRKGTGLTEVLWFADRLDEFKGLRLAMRERAQVSEVVAAFERDVSERLRLGLVDALRPDVADGLLEATADAVLALCEGLLHRDFTRARRRALIRFGVERLVPAIE